MRGDFQLIAGTALELYRFKTGPRCALIEAIRPSSPIIH